MAVEWNRSRKPVDSQQYGDPSDVELKMGDAFSTKV